MCDYIIIFSFAQFNAIGILRTKKHMFMRFCISLKFAKTKCKYPSQIYIYRVNTRMRAYLCAPL